MKKAVFFLLLLSSGIPVIAQSDKVEIVSNEILALKDNANKDVFSGGDDLFIVGQWDFTSFTQDNTMKWQFYPWFNKDVLEIGCYTRLTDGTVLLAGAEGKKNCWIMKVDLDGQDVWKKSLPMKGTNILALAEDPKGKGFLALVSQTTEKKSVQQFIWTFDADGNPTRKLLMTGDNYNYTFNQDVQIFAGKTGICVFGATARNTYQGLKFAWPADGVDQIKPERFQILEKQVVDRAYSNFITVRTNDNFYSAYSVKGAEGRGQDFRLAMLDSNLVVTWTKDLGGSADEGLTSLIIDDRGHPLLAGFSYSGASGDKSEPAFEKEHCDAWVIKVNATGEKIWDKTIGGPGCVSNVRLFNDQKSTGVIFNDGTGTLRAVLKDR